MTINKVIMPKLGESVTEGVIVKWLVKEGDKIEQYQNLLEVETAKVIAEVPSTISGVVKKLLYKEGDTVAVGKDVCTIETENGSANQLEEKPAPPLEAAEKPQEVPPTKQTNSANIAFKAVRYSPAVLTLAQEHNIDLNSVKGTGESNRVTRRDLLKLINSGNADKSHSNNEAIAPNKPIKNNVGEDKFVMQEGDVVLPVSPVRRAIANKMLQSVKEIPHAWMMTEVDATNLVKLREKMKHEFHNTEGIGLTYFPFFIECVVRALKQHPILNSKWYGDSIVIQKDINISVAVAANKELFVPVIKNADHKNIKGLALEIHNLANKARNSQLSVDDMSNGTFTINNTGSFGSIQSMGIINHPQVAILQIESIKKRPIIVNDNNIAVRDMVNLCLSIDHRVLDGMEAGRFLSAVKENIENITL